METHPPDTGCCLHPSLPTTACPEPVCVEEARKPSALIVSRRKKEQEARSLQRQGLSHKEIAKEMDISISAVYNYLRGVLA